MAGHGRTRRRARLVGALLGAFLAGPAAAQVDVRIGTCAVQVLANGVLAPSADLRTLSTSNPGGRPARIQVRTLLTGTITGLTCSLIVQVNCFRVTVSLPSGFAIEPPSPGGAPAIVGGWRPQGSGATLNVLSAVILNGTHDLELHLTASTAQAFVAGDYRADQRISCS